MLCDDKALNSAIQYVWPVRCVARGDVSLVCVSRPVVAGRRGGPRAGPPMDPGGECPCTSFYSLFFSLSVSITNHYLFVCVLVSKTLGDRASRIQRACLYFTASLV